MGVKGVGRGWGEGEFQGFCFVNAQAFKMK